MIQFEYYIDNTLIDERYSVGCIQYDYLFGKSLVMYLN